MSRTYKKYTPEQKLAIVKEHLINKVAVSDICDKYGCAPSAFYSWQQDLFEQGAQCFESKSKKKPQVTAQTKRIQELEAQLAKSQAKLAQKNEVVAELMEDHIKLKKSLGEI